MRTNVVEKGKWEREVAVEVPAKRIDAELQRAYQQYQKRIEMPGFRKGKVPLHIIKSRYGERIRGEVLGDLLPQLAEEAARDTGLVPAAPPSIIDLKHEPGQDLTFTMSFDIWPDLGEVQFKGLKAGRTVHEVTDAEVDEQLQEIRTRQATERSVERPLQKGDVLLADLQRLDQSGVPIIGEKYEERRFLIGEGNAPSPQFEEALVGISAGEERDVRFTYREDLPDPKLAGTQDRFSVTARHVHERVLPELDDEFAKDLGDQFQGLDDLRQHIRAQLEQRWQYVAEQRLRSQLVERLVNDNPFEMPQSMVRNYLEEMHRAQERRAGRGRTHDHGHDHGHDHDHGVDEPHEHSEEEKLAAERSLRSLLLLAAVRKQAEISVTEEELDQFVTQRAEAIGVKPEDLRLSSRFEELRHDLEERKVFELLEQQAEITEEKA